MTTTETSPKARRYVAVIDMYVWGETDEQALNNANVICKRINNQDDRHATLQTLTEQPFGSFSHREVKINP